MTYGAFKMITRPAPGNHEFYTEHGAVGVAGYGYFSYFNGVQHNTDGTMMTATIADNPDTGGTFTQPVPYSDGQAGHFEQSGGLGTAANGGPVGVGDGWYSYNLGSWHLISLNIECETQPGGCTGSWIASELQWLKNDLAANHSACTLAYWHQPTFSPTNGIAVPEGPTAQQFWQLLYEYGADLVLNGHDHLYGRYRPLDPSGKYDPKKGIREFVVGTGGETLDPVVTTTVTSGSGETNMEDPSGNVNFNAENLEAGTGQFWGVMRPDAQSERLRVGFRVGIEGSCTANRTGYLQRQGRRHLPRSSPTGGSDRIVFATFGLTLLQYAFPLREKSRRGNFFCLALSSCSRPFLIRASAPTIVIFLTRLRNIAPATITAVRDKKTDSVGAAVSGMANGFSISAPEPRPYQGEKSFASWCVEQESARTKSFMPESP